MLQIDIKQKGNSQLMLYYCWTNEKFTIDDAQVIHRQRKNSQLMIHKCETKRKFAVDAILTLKQM